MLSRRRVRISLELGLHTGVPDCTWGQIDVGGTLIAEAY